MINRPHHNRLRRHNPYNYRDTIVHSYTITITLAPAELTQLIKLGKGSVNLGVSQLLKERQSFGNSQQN